jgi:carboxylesterase type B
MRFSLVFVAACGFSLTGAHFGDDDLTVKTNGGTIHGKLDDATPAVRQFLGIPYARPPVNDLRFAPPQPALPFGELNAKEFGPSCMRMSKSCLHRSIPLFDCLEAGPLRIHPG